MTTDPFDQAADFDEFEVDLSEASDDVPPEGVFVARVAGIGKDISKSGNPMALWDFRIVADENGKKTEHAGKAPKTLYTAFTPKALWKLDEVLTALGVIPPPEKGVARPKLKFTKADVMDKICLIEIKHGDYNNRPQAEINALQPYTGDLPADLDDIPF